MREDVLWVTFAGRLVVRLRFAPNFAPYWEPLVRGKKQKSHSKRCGLKRRNGRTVGICGLEDLAVSAMNGNPG